MVLITAIASELGWRKKTSRERGQQSTGEAKKNREMVGMEV